MWKEINTIQYKTMWMIYTNCLAHMTTYILGYIAQLLSSPVTHSDIDWKQ